MERTKSTQKLAVAISTAITVMALTATSMAKILKAPILVASFTRSGIIDHITQLGFVTLALMALYLHPKTMKIGLLMLSGYFGGAIAVDSLHNEPVLIPIIILGVIWINAFLRNSEIFVPSRIPTTAA